MMNWKPIYSGVFLEDALKTDSVMNIDRSWASVVNFPYNNIIESERYY